MPHFFGGFQRTPRGNQHFFLKKTHPSHLAGLWATAHPAFAAFQPTPAGARSACTTGGAAAAVPRLPHGAGGRQLPAGPQPRCVAACRRRRRRSWSWSFAPRGSSAAEACCQGPLQGSGFYSTRTGRGWLEGKWLSLGPGYFEESRLGLVEKGHQRESQGSSLRETDRKPEGLPF